MKNDATRPSDVPKKCQDGMFGIGMLDTQNRHELLKRHPDATADLTAGTTSTTITILFSSLCDMT